MKLRIFFFFIITTAYAYSQDPWSMTKEDRDAYFAKIRELSAEDHKQMMKQLGIESIRPGANGSGDPNAPNAANYDETKANPYPDLPDPLVFNNGKKVTSAKDWKKRRVELIELFDREMYGRQPAVIPSVKWEVISTTSEMEGELAVVKKVLKGHVDNSSYPSITVDIDLTLVTPAVGSSRVDLQACKLEYSIVSPK